MVSEQRYILHDLIAFPGHNIYPDKNADVDKDYYEICSRQIDASFKQYFFKMTMIVGALFLGNFEPTYLLLTKGLKVTITQVQFPFADENSNAEFLGNLALEVLVGVYGFSAYVGLDICVSICTDFLLVSRSSLEYRLQKLLKKVPFRRSQMMIKFKSIVNHIEEFDRYIFYSIESLSYSYAFQKSDESFNIEHILQICWLCERSLLYSSPFNASIVRVLNWNVHFL